MKWSHRLGVLSAGLACLSALAGCSGGCTTARLSEATIAARVDPTTKQPIAPTDSFTPDAPVIHCTAKLEDAPDGTKVRAMWIATKVVGAKPGQLIREVSVTAGGSRYLDFRLTRPTKGWPAGEYTVKLQLANAPTVSATFRVGAAGGSPATPAKAATPTKAKAAAVTGDGVVFTKKVPAPGQVRHEVSRMEMELEIDVVQGGQVVAKMDNSNDARTDRRVTVLAVNDRAATRVKVVYLKKREIESSGKKRKQTISPLEGQTVIVTAAGDRLLVTDANGAEVAPKLAAATREDNQAVGKPNRFAALLPDRPLRAGELLNPPQAVIREMLGANQAELPMTVERGSFTFKGVTRTNGATHGLFDVALKIQIANKPMTINMDLKGQLAVDVATCWPVTLEVKGPLRVSGRQGPSQVAGKGQARISIVATYPGAAAGE